MPHLLDVLTPVDAWLAAHTKRAAATHETLAKLVDDSVLREALAG